MSYQKTKPIAADYISTSQGDLQGNFLAVDGAWNVNHVQMNLPAEGKHHFIHIPNGTFGAAFPLATGGTEVGLYAESGNLYFRPTNQIAGSHTNDVNLTGGTKAIMGWCYLPNGIIMKWGRGSVWANKPAGTGTAVLISGAGIPTITTVILPIVTRIGDPTSEGIVTYESFDETAHTVTVRGIKSIAGAQSTNFIYLLFGI